MPESSPGRSHRTCRGHRTPVRSFFKFEIIFSSSAQGPESSRRGAMTPLLVPPSSVRLHEVVCGLRIKIVPRTLAFVIFYSATALNKLNKKEPPALPRCGADLPSTDVPHGTERRQPTTQYLPTYDTLPFRRFSSLRGQHHKPTHPTVTSRCTIPTSFTEQGTKRLRVYWPRPPTTGRARRHIECTYRLRLEVIHSSSSTTSTSHPASTCCTNSTSLSPSKRVFDLLGITHVGVTAQGCAFTSQHGRVCDSFTVAHVRVTAQGCASEREIESFNSFSAQGPESSHMPELSHPCAIKIKVRNH